VLNPKSERLVTRGGKGIYSQAVLTFIDLLAQAGDEAEDLAFSQRTLKDRLLNPNAVATTYLRHSTETPATSGSIRTDVVGD